jgi:hypothetical protein
MSKYKFKVNVQYKRAEVIKAIGLDPEARGGPWYTGYAEHDGADFIFCNVGAAGRTGHDYDNYFDAEELVWRGKTNSHKHQPTIRRMTSPGAEVHVFWRAEDRDPFTYAGQGKAVEVSDETPVMVRWRFGKTQAAQKDLRSLERLPAKVFDAIGADHILEAVEMLLDGYTDHAYGPSTDYDLIAKDGKRLPPKAVFGIASRK